MLHVFGMILIFACLIHTAAAASAFSMYALNANGLVNSTKLHHISNVINARNPHTFTLSESKTNTRTSPNLPNSDYNIFEEPGVQADNHHLYKWGVALGICKSLQVAQRVQVNAAALKGRVIAVDIILQANNSSSFTHRVIGAYAPWDPRTPATRDFWPELTKLIVSTTTSWTLGSDLNATISASERSSGGADARSQYLKFLVDVNALNLWRNNPDQSLECDWTSCADCSTTSGNIIDHIVSSHQLYIDGEINVADGSQDFVPFTNHRAVIANIVYTNPSGSADTVFPAFQPMFNKPWIKFPARIEKYQHETFRTLMDEQLAAVMLHDVAVTDEDSFLAIYNSFTTILIPAAEEAYSRVIPPLRRRRDSRSPPAHHLPLPWRPPRLHLPSSGIPRQPLPRPNNPPVRHT
ncbi:hypothetical protein B0H14DRAFT_2568771 [Mycena olivaceomarginata]|nr:hypothetical protein B0H14DRAFT_2568771 [Mycena olivaceomarginata]